MKEGKIYPYLEGKVKDVMTPNPVTINEDEPITTLKEIFVSYKYHGMPVVNDKDQLVGVVRDTDILSVFARRITDVRNTTVGDVMHSPPFTIGPEDTLQRAVTKMFSDGTRFLVVADKKRNILGVVTRIDLVKGIRWRGEH